MAWIECGMGALALFGWIRGMVPKQRNPSRIQAQGATNSFADVVPNGSFETPKSKAKPMAWIECGMGALALFGWIGGMVPKQRNPSRIQAQGATNSFADVVPNGSFETPKSKAKPTAWIECGMGAVALFGWIGGMVPKQRNPSRISQTWCRTAPSNPLKNKAGWVGLKKQSWMGGARMGGARSMCGGWMELIGQALVAGTWRMDGRASTHGRSIIVGGHGRYTTKAKEEAA